MQIRLDIPLGWLNETRDLTIEKINTHSNFCEEWNSTRLKPIISPEGLDKSNDAIEEQPIFNTLMNIEEVAMQVLEYMNWEDTTVCSLVNRRMHTLVNHLPGKSIVIFMKTCRLFVEDTAYLSLDSLNIFRRFEFRLRRPLNISTLKKYQEKRKLNFPASFDINRILFPCLKRWLPPSLNFELALDKLIRTAIFVDSGSTQEKITLYFMQHVPFQMKWHLKPYYHERSGIRLAMEDLNFLYKEELDKVKNWDVMLYSKTDIAYEMNSVESWASYYIRTKGHSLSTPKPLIIAAIKKDRRLFRQLDVKWQKDPDVFTAAVNRDPKFILELDKTFQMDHELALISIRLNFDILVELPCKLTCDPLFKAKLEQDPIIRKKIKPSFISNSPKEEIDLESLKNFKFNEVD